MNLVAKEFVAARDDERRRAGAQRMAGAAQELDDALIINPYDVDAFAAALERAIDMPIEEQIARMRRMRRVVAGRNVFKWASDILDQFGEVQDDQSLMSPWPAAVARPKIVRRLASSASNVRG